MKTDPKTKERISKIVRNRIPESNIFISKMLLTFSAICFLLTALFEFGFLKSQGTIVHIALVATPVFFILSATLCLYRKGEGRAFQYIFFILLALFWLQIEIMSAYRCKLLLPIIIIMTLRYYNKKFTVFTFAATIISLFASICSNAFLYAQTELIDLGTVSIEGARNVWIEGFLFDTAISLKPSSTTLLANGMRLVFLPNALFLIITLVFVLRFMRNNLRNILAAEELAAQEANQRLELADMRTRITLSQLKPHFIYSTLSSISDLCAQDPKRAQKLVGELSDYLENNLNSLGTGENSISSFEEELDHIKCYLSIELVRYADILKVEYDIKERYFRVPTLSIQPLVENAVTDGILKRSNGGTLKISTEANDDYYIITVADDGVGFDPSEKDCEGIEGIRRRIELYGGRLVLRSAPGSGTKITVLIPKQ